MTHGYGQSALWTHNNATQVTEEAVVDLTSFKSSAVNYKLALWDPQVNGVRYLKALIYYLAAHLSAENRTRLRRIHHRETGGPIAVRYDGESVCMDYLQTVFELDFISRGVELDGMNILEIGAGYGRTCHAMLSNHDVAGYSIIDLDNSLTLAREYLRVVLDEHQFAKVRFFAVHDLEQSLTGARIDLCVNIDSFAEMSAQTVHNYLGLIDQHCDRLYVNNPVGKYLDKTLDNHSQGSELVAIALDTGLMRDIIDVHDNRAIEAQVEQFIAAYRPTEGWECVASAGAVPWSYYWQALYQRRARA
jgi:putative sugar O-methyltransferase